MFPARAPRAALLWGITRCVVLCLVIVCAGGRAWAGGFSARVLADAPLPDAPPGMRWEVEDRSPAELTITAAPVVEGARGGLVRVQSPPREGRRVSADGLSFEVETWGTDPRTAEALVGLAAAVAERHGGWREGVSAGAPPQWRWALAWLGLLPVVLLARLFRRPITAEVRLVHALPVVIQLSVFGYWAAWWSPVAGHMAVVLGQVGLAFSVDGLLSLLLRKRWVVGLAPVPIVLSGALFLWFEPLASALVVVVAIVAKVAIVREGRHFLNPSATGLVLIGVACTFIPALGPYAPLFHTMNLPPWMSEWVLLAALVPQSRLRIVLVTLGAFVAYNLAGPLGPGPALVRPATILAFTLLATDPATIPRTAGGQVLFGALFGLLVRVTSILLVHLGQPDDLSKVLPVPLCNLLVPRLDALATQMLLGRWFRFEQNRLHVGAWFAVAVAALWMEKPKNFEAVLHWTYRTPGLVFADEGLPECAENPAFCRAFGIPRPHGEP